MKGLRPATPATITIAARAEIGSDAQQTEHDQAFRAMASAPTTPVSCVFAPAASATGVRDALLLIGIRT